MATAAEKKAAAEAKAQAEAPQEPTPVYRLYSEKYPSLEVFVSGTESVKFEDHYFETEDEELAGKVLVAATPSGVTPAL